MDMSAHSELVESLKRDVIEVLNLEEIAPEAIENDAPLFGEGLGLDSIDALELTLMLERSYGCRLTSPEEGRKAFASIEAMATYIEANRK